LLWSLLALSKTVEKPAETFYFHAQFIFGCASTVRIAFSKPESEPVLNAWRQLILSCRKPVFPYFCTRTKRLQRTKTPNE
jgi:hypothetical protein